MTKTLTHNGVTQTIRQWSKETGLPDKTISGRIDRGWNVEQALTAKPNTFNQRHSKGRTIKENIQTSFDKVWRKVGKKEFERQLQIAFDEDALKVVKDFAQYLPKDALERAETNKDKAVVRIEFNDVPKPRITLEENGE